METIGQTYHGRPQMQGCFGINLIATTLAITIQRSKGTWLVPPHVIRKSTQAFGCQQISIRARDGSQYSLARTAQLRQLLDAHFLSALNANNNLTLTCRNSAHTTQRRSRKPPKARKNYMNVFKIR
eukprot:6467853-Amphidinium_carterae.2